VTCATFYEWDLVCHHTYFSTHYCSFTAFVTMCEAYMGIEPHFNMCNYFFRSWLQQGLGAETAALGNVDIFF
jgi:hypothetical protein